MLSDFGIDISTSFPTLKQKVYFCSAGLLLSSFRVKRVVYSEIYLDIPNVSGDMSTGLVDAKRWAIVCSADPSSPSSSSAIAPILNQKHMLYYLTHAM